MVLLILGICIVGIIIAIVLDCLDVDRDISYCIFVVSGIGLFVALIAVLWLGVDVSKLNVIDDNIAMYEAENQKIELQIADTVKQYQAYESGIFSEVSPENAVTLVSLYPDLKADTLVQKQIEIYVENNKEIKELKEQQISGNVKRWWLYFGGRSDTE